MATLEEIADLVRRLRDDVASVALGGGGEYVTRGELSSLVSQLQGEMSPPMASIRFDTQAIGSSLTPSTPTPMMTASNATWNYGLNIDINDNPVTARIQVPSTPFLSRVMFVLWWYWAANATGTRILRWTDNSGNQVDDTRAAITEGGVGTACHITHVRRVQSADTWYSIQVAQNSGGNLNGDGLLVAVKIG